MITEDWYERRHELLPGMVFKDIQGDTVMLDERVPGDGTKWYVADLIGDRWSFEGGTVEPSDLKERLE